MKRTAGSSGDEWEGLALSGSPHLLEMGQEKGYSPMQRRRGSGRKEYGKNKASIRSHVVPDGTMNAVNTASPAKT